MLGNIVAGKVAGVILAGALTTGGAIAAVNAPAGSPLAGVRQTAQNAAGEVATFAKGQGDNISALAHSIPGGPGKGQQISAVAREHGKAVSTAARAHADPDAVSKANGHGKGHGASKNSDASDNGK